MLVYPVLVGKESRNWGYQGAFGEVIGMKPNENDRAMLRLATNNSLILAAVLCVENNTASVGEPPIRPLRRTDTHPACRNF